MSERFVYPGTFKGTVLQDELNAAFPEWTVEEDGILIELFVLNVNPGVARLTVPDGTVKADVDVVMAAHDPNELDFHENEALKNQETLGTLEAKLVAPPLSLNQDELDMILGRTVAPTIEEAGTDSNGRGNNGR